MEYKTIVALALSLFVLWVFQPRPPHLSLGAPDHPDIGRMSSEFEDCKLKVGGLLKREEAAKKDREQVTAALESMQTIRSMIEEIPTKQYVVEQADVFKKESAVFQNTALSLQKVVIALSDSGIAKLDVQEISALPQKVANIAQTVSNSVTPSKTITQVKEDIDSLRQETDKKLASSLASTKDIVATSNATVSGQLNTLQARLGSFASAADVATLGGRVGTIEATQPLLKSSIDKAGEKLDKLDSGFSPLMSRVADQSNGISALQGSVGDHEKAIKVLHDNEKKLADSYASVYDALSSALGQIKDLKAAPRSGQQ